MSLQSLNLVNRPIQRSLERSFNALCTLVSGLGSLNADYSFNPDMMETVTGDTLVSKISSIHN